MDLSSYSESFKFWLQFFCQKSQLQLATDGANGNGNGNGNSELLANFWTLFQLQQHYATLAPPNAAKLDLTGADNANLGLGLGLGHFAQRCSRKLAGVGVGVGSDSNSNCNSLSLDRENHSHSHSHTHTHRTLLAPELHKHQHHRAKRTPKRLSSVSLSACNSRHSPSSPSLVSASPRSNGFSNQNHNQTGSGSGSGAGTGNGSGAAQPQPIIKMDLSKEEIAEINSELSKIENRIGPYKCMLCLFTFDDAIQLACHSCPNIVNVEYRCPECSKVFNCPANLASHRRWHKRRQTTVPGTCPNTGVGVGVGPLPTFAATLTSPAASSLSSYDLFELPAKRPCLSLNSAAAGVGVGVTPQTQTQAQAQECKQKQPARFSVEFLLGCKLLDQDAFSKPAGRNAEIETS